MNITLYKYYILPEDTTNPTPLLGRILDEDMEAEKYLVTIYNTSQEFQGFKLMTFEDLQDYRVFKGKEEALDYFREYWT